jgi:hypothetical protein
MDIAEEPAENSCDELTQIEYDKKTTLLGGKPLVGAMLEIKERGASHQNIADEIDEMTKGNKPRFGGFPCPSVSMVQKICSDVNKLQQAGVASRLAKFEFQRVSSSYAHATQQQQHSTQPSSLRTAALCHSMQLRLTKLSYRCLKASCRSSHKACCVSVRRIN